MKTHCLLYLIVSVIPIFLFGSIEINGAVDSRLEITDFTHTHFMMHGAELNLRYTYADAKGDRLIGFIQLPYAQHWRSNMFFYHYGDAYLVVKGALQYPNIQIGRFDLPFGHIRTFDTHFLLLPQLFEAGLGSKKDIGVLLFGNYRNLTYDIAFTQGFNSYTSPRNDRPITARIGLENEIINIGLSRYTATHTTPGTAVRQRTSIDFEKNINPFVVRGQGVFGNNPNGKGFSLILEFPFFYSIEARASGLVWLDDANYQAYGVELKKEISHFDIGLGVMSEKRTDTEIKAIAQLVIKL